MKSFNVLIENHDKFEAYDIMPRLKNSYIEMIERIQEYGESEYLHYLKTNKDIEEWLDRALQYMFWGKCEYEIILSPWPSYTNDRDEEIILPKKCRKIDIYEQCKMNFDLIKRLFIEEILLVYTPSVISKRKYFK